MRHDLGEPRVDAGQCLDAGQCARSRGVRIAFVGIVEQANCGLRGLGEPAAIRMARALLGKSRRLRPP